MKKTYKTILIIILISIVILLFYLKGYTIENFEIQNYELPKTIWSYWNSDNLPEQVQLIYENNKKNLNNYDYKLLTPSNKKEYIGEDDLKKEVSPQHYSDWLRLYLLQKHGGVWMDISIIVNTSFDDLWNKSVIKKSELTGFSAPNLENDSIDFPVIENWFIMAPINSEIIKLWHEEYNKALEKGFKEYKLEQIKNGVNYQNIFGNNEDEVYLTQHGCLQVVLQKRLNRKGNIYLNNSYDSMFKLHVECNWDGGCLNKKINDVSNSKKIPYIKLRGNDRQVVNLAKYFENTE